MSTQIAVRLPDELVAFVDDLVREGGAASRAVVVSRALVRERRRLAAERDVEILRARGDGEEFADLAAYAARTPLDLD